MVTIASKEYIIACMFATVCNLEDADMGRSKSLKKAGN
jgi:hypothetical protein